MVLPSRMFRSVCLCLAALAPARGPAQPAASALVNARSGLPCPDPAKSFASRPGEPGRPTQVMIGAVINDVVRINDAEQTISLDVTLVTRWKDARLADASRGEDDAVCLLDPARIWTPALEAAHMRKRDRFYEDRFLLNAAGEATLGRRLLVEIAVPLDLRDFPFDKHVLRLTIWPVLSRIDEMELQPLTRITSRAATVSAAGWDFGRVWGESRTGQREARIGQYSRYDLCLEAKRQWTSYGWKLGVPLLLIVMMAFGVFVLPPATYMMQVNLGVTSMLTLIAYMFALSNSLPRISYLTRADRALLGAAVLIFFGLIKAIATTRFVAMGNEARAQTIARWTRWVFAGGMALNLVNAFLR